MTKTKHLSTHHVYNLFDIVLILVVVGSVQPKRLKHQELQSLSDGSIYAIKQKSLEDIITTACLSRGLRFSFWSSLIHGTANERSALFLENQQLFTMILMHPTVRFYSHPCLSTPDAMRSALCRTVVRRLRGAAPLRPCWGRRRTRALSSPAGSTSYAHIAKVEHLRMQSFQKHLAPRVLLPSSLVVDNGWHPVMDLCDDRFAKTAVDVRALLIKDTDSEIDDGYYILDEGHTIDNGFCDFGLDLLKIVLS